ncbi:MAG: phosphoribosylformylglycinamidine synthase subunit PurQ [Pseudobdellovibrionaceae bacterium]
MKTAILVFPGTNREHDMADAIHTVIGKKPDLIWHKESSLANYDLIVLPGGFSYGDYLRCGAMAAHSPIMQEVIRQAERGTRIFGVCNGFQMLIETRILPGALLKNESLKFICKNVHLKTETNDSPFTKGLDKAHPMCVPVAHGEGNYFADDTILKELEDGDRIAFRYCDENGAVTQAANANGSTQNIAGIMNRRKTILGMMPHPENATQPHQSSPDGLPLFRTILESLAA